MSPGFGKVAGDAGFCRGRRGRCRPGSSWHTLKNFATDSFAHEVSRAKRKSDLSVIQIPRHFDQIHGSIICAEHGPIQIDLHFTERAGSRYPKACLHNVSRKIFEDLTFRRANLKSVLTPKADPILKRSNDVITRQLRPRIAHVLRTKKFKSKCPRRFREANPDIWHTCSMSPCRPDRLTTSVSFFIFAGNLGFLWYAQIHEKNGKLSDEKEEKKAPFDNTGRQELTKHVCKNSRSISTKRRGLSTRTKFIELSLNQLVP